MSYPEEDIEALKEEVRRLRAALARSTLDLRASLWLRGFTVYSTGKREDLLVPLITEYVDAFYEAMTKYSFRLFLRDIIKHQKGFSAKDVTRYATAEATGDFIKFVLDIGLIEKKGSLYRLCKPIRSFGDTLEWFVTQMLRREFHAEALRGVKFKGEHAAGDYDIIAKVDTLLMYLEAKSSPPKQVAAGEIAAFLDRVDELRPEVSVFFMDTELRMKDKIVLMFEEELKRRMDSPPQVSRMYKELFNISDRIYIINSKGGIEGNITRVLRSYFGRQAPLSGPDAKGAI